MHTRGVSAELPGALWPQDYDGRAFACRRQSRIWWLDKHERRWHRWIPFGRSHQGLCQGQVVNSMHIYSKAQWPQDYDGRASIRVPEKQKRPTSAFGATRTRTRTRPSLMARSFASASWIPFGRSHQGLCQGQIQTIRTN